MGGRSVGGLVLGSLGGLICGSLGGLVCGSLGGLIRGSLGGLVCGRIGLFVLGMLYVVVNKGGLICDSSVDINGGIACYRVSYPNCGAVALIEILKRKLAKMAYGCENGIGIEIIGTESIKSFYGNVIYVIGEDGVVNKACNDAVVDRRSVVRDRHAGHEAVEDVDLHIGVTCRDRNVSKLACKTAE